MRPITARPFRPAFDYHELDKESNVWVQITDTERLREITRQISPITHVSADDPPTLDHPRRCRRAGADSAIRGVRQENEGALASTPSWWSRRAVATAGWASNAKRDCWATGLINISTSPRRTNPP